MRLANNLLTVAVMGTLLAVSPLAAGKSSDRKQPMDVAADRTDAMLGDDSDSTLYGNVKITQGSLEVDADKAVIHRKGGDISQVVLTGAPAKLRQTADNGEPMTARAQQIVYTLSSDVIVLSGDVVIEQPRGNLRGQTIKYDLNTGRLDGGGDGNRVQMRILPKSGGSSN
ncbi:lipopolysaccharide transport periplasmic protein LptA [Arenimonas sp.]|uniref:lipopolysaccharide transport periplasmic protein LptA n=1 Tax=Arenimonas sp. TaxID=1872635 RepID=UPI0039E559E3